MKLNKVICTFVVLFLIFSVGTLRSMNAHKLTNSDLPVHNLDTGLDYATIQEAIDAIETMDGHTLRVDFGTYYENVFVSKSVTLIGENRETAIIDGGRTGDVFKVSAPNVTISNFTIQNGYTTGIYVRYFDGIKIQNNIISNNPRDGIRVWDSNDNIIEENLLFSNGNGIFLNFVSGNTIRLNNASKNNADGIVLGYCHESICAENIASNNYGSGIHIDASSSNTFYGNTVSTNDDSGIVLATIKIENNIYASTNNNFSNNNVLNNTIAIYLAQSSNNRFFNNNFGNNVEQVFDEPFENEFHSLNIWDNALYSGGNYWSDYTGGDLLHGPFQNETGPDGIGDDPYIINEYNQDNYPLIGRFSDFKTATGYNVNVISNSTIEKFEYFESNSTIKIIVSDSSPTQTSGFCRVCITHALMDPDKIWTLIDDGQTKPLFANHKLQDNSTHRWIYVAYPHSRHEVLILEDVTPPTIANVYQQPPENSVYQHNKVEVYSTVTDGLSGIRQVILNYTVNTEEWFIENMTNVEMTLYTATIPEFPYCTNISYAVVAVDKVDNIITSEELGYIYEYHVIPEFSLSFLLPFVIATLLVVMLCVYNNVKAHDDL